MHLLEHSLQFIVGIALILGLYKLSGLGIIAVIGNPTYPTALASTTLKNFRDTMADNLSKANPFWWWLTANDRIRTEDGGLSIEVQLMYGKNSTVRSYNGFDPIDSTPQEGMTVVSYPWQQVAGTVTISGRDMRLNSGRSRQINLLKAKQRQLEISLQQEFNIQFFGDGTGNSSKDFFGLQLIVEDGTAWGTLAGIDRSDTLNSWWRNQFLDNASVAFGTGADAAGIKFMRKGYNNASRGNEHPDIGITTQVVYEAYENALAPIERILDPKIADAGFQALKFKGMFLFFDADCITGGIYMLNSDYLELVKDKLVWLTQQDFQEAIEQDAMLSKNLSMGNLVCSNCALQFYGANMAP